MNFYFWRLEDIERLKQKAESLGIKKKSFYDLIERETKQNIYCRSRESNIPCSCGYRELEELDNG